MLDKPEIFTQALWDLAAPDMFNLYLSNEEIDRIYEKVLELTKWEYMLPRTFLDWRDITFDAMERLGYELPEEE